MKPIGTMWRVVVELSPMSNNDEWVSHTTVKITHEEFPTSTLAKRFKRGLSSFNEPHLVFCRPVMDVEIEAGLNTAYAGDAYDEKKCPEVTMLLDGAFKVFERVTAYRDVIGMSDATDIVTEVVAMSYYDCMSGGMPLGAILACRYIVENFGCNLNEQVYPSDANHWHNLGDWMKETQKYQDKALDFRGLLSLPEGTR